MDEGPRQALSSPTGVAVGLILLDLMIITGALCAGGPGEWGEHFRHGSFIIWLGSAQTLGGAFLFVACYLAGVMVKVEQVHRRGYKAWLVLALALCFLAVDYQFQLCGRLA